MPEWVLVGENERGESIVVTDWPLTFETMLVADARFARHRIATFRSRWEAKRVLRKRNEWRNFRCIRREKL